MFGEKQLYVIPKGMCVLIGMSFLLPFNSSFLSGFSTVLMCLPNSSELYPSSRNQCLSFCSDVQSRSMLYRFV